MAIEEIVSDLKKYQTDDALVDVFMLKEDINYAGFVVDIGEDHVVITRLYQLCWQNGFRAIRLQDIDEVLLVSDEEDLSQSFVRRSRTARGEQVPLSLPFSAETFFDFLKVVCDHYPIVVMSGETPSGKTFGFAASVSSFTQIDFQARFFSLEGFWEDREQTVPLAEINEICFDSEYERTLVAISNLGDA